MYKNIKGLDKVYGRFILWYTPQKLFFHNYFLIPFSLSFLIFHMYTGINIVTRTGKSIFS